MQKLSQPHNSHGKAQETFVPSEDQYRTTLNSMRDAIHVVNSDLVILLMNDRFENWCGELGLEIDNPIGKTIFDVFPHLPDRLKKEYRQVFSSGQVLTTVEVTEAQGHKIATETRKIPVTDEVGQIGQVITVIRDITEQERVRKENEAAKERIQLLFETIPHALYECDKNGIITLTNSTYSKITGYAKNELVGMHIQDLMLPGAQRDEVASYLEQLVKEQPTPTPYLATNLTKNGQPIDVEVNWNYRCNDQGQVDGFVCILSDITERKKADQALNQSEEQYRSLVANIPGVVWRSDQTGNTTFIGQNVKEIYGYSQEEIYDGGSQLWFGRIHPDDVATVQHSFKLLFEESMPLDVEYRIQRKDGEWIWLQDRSTGTYEKEGVKYADGVFIEVTDRKQAEQTLQESEERFRVLSEASFEGVVFSDKGILVDANKAFLDIYGYRYDEAIGKPVISFVLPEHRDMVIQKIQSGFSGVYDHKGLHKNGQVIDLEVHGRNVVYHGRNIRMTAVRDITERKKAEAKLVEYQSQLKSLTAQLTIAEEQEKRRIAEHLHDEVGQCLAFCKMKLQLVLDSISERATVDELETVCEMLTQSMLNVKDVTYGLSSPILKELGFEKAVGAWLKDDIERQHDVKTELIVDGQAKLMNENLKTLLFRSIRELVTNAVKHANPNQIHVYIDRQKDNISVRVEDDGEGFDPDTIEYNSKKGFGLFSIRERLDYLGGELELISLSNHGCKATLKIPLD
ncbi:PAS domain S-box protein [Planctomycetota bacterium]